MLTVEVNRLDMQLYYQFYVESSGSLLFSPVLFAVIAVKLPGLIRILISFMFG